MTGLRAQRNSLCSGARHGPAGQVPPGRHWSGNKGRSMTTGALLARLITEEANAIASP